MFHSIRCALLLCVMLLCVITVANASEPPLPAGLAPAAPREEPALPEGLEPATSREEPALPEGLEPTTPREEPALPAGLEPAGDEPALPEGLAPDTEPAEPMAREESRAAPPLDFHGFWDMRAGSRIVSDKAQSKDATLGEMRLQLRTDKGWNNAFLEFTGDGVFDAVEERARLDIRQLRLTWSPMNTVDIRVGRQVLTWGTGDMLFINDMFPKDWISFFSGRDVEYLKAPSNAARVGWYNDVMNVEVVYTPRFDPDRYITGKRFSYYNPLLRRMAGRDNQQQTREPDSWFRDDEVAVRLYRSIGNGQLAFYGYSGYWKSPGGMQLLPNRAVFPRLRVYGASLRGAIGQGIGNIELGYYDSRQDRRGNNPFINNSEFRLLLGYEREIGREFTAALQYYLEYMMRHGNYRDSLPFFMNARDRDRHVFTLRLTKMLMNQNLILSLFAYMSPSDKDAYLRPNVTYKVSDHWTVEAGANIFLGDQKTTFFGQFQDNTNVYAGARFAF